jgi:hypothetical protein
MKKIRVRELAGRDRGSRLRETSDPAIFVAYGGVSLKPQNVK